MPNNHFAILCERLHNYISANYPNFFPSLSFYSYIIIHLVVVIFCFYSALFPPYEFLGLKVPEAINNDISLVDVPLNIETKKTDPAAILHHCKLCNCPCACVITSRR